MTALILLLSALFAEPVEAAPDLRSPAHVFQWLISEKDYLSARIYMKKLNRSKLSTSQWHAIRSLVFRHPQVGIDLALREDRLPVPKGPHIVDRSTQRALVKADQLMFEKRFDEAFTIYQQVAKSVKDSTQGKPYMKPNYDAVYPGILHSMARALFGAGRYVESMDVYGWIPSSYHRYRQVLFERMWAAFRAGHIDHALGMVAAQRSAFFSRFLEPETYIVQIYLYKVLCRDEDLKMVLKEIDAFKKAIRAGKYTFRDWAHSESATLALLRLLEADEAISGSPISEAARKSEQAAIRDLLEKLFEPQKARLLERLGLVEAFANLAAIPGSGGLRQLEKVPSRAALFEANLEIWPADNAEDWIDEVGKQRFIGESLCKKN